jgi:4-hydroxy-4-methyl-2-oxoglutarate aldolase
MYHVIHNIERVAPEVVRKALDSGIGSASLHEAGGRIGAMSVDIKPIYSGMRVCGPAYTVDCYPADNLILHKAVASARPGDVLVVAIDGYEGGPLGEVMATGAKSREIVGLVIDGHIRDGRAIRALEWPVFARGLCIKGTLKAILGKINHPISCAGVVVNPGDLVFGDDDGVVVIPREVAAEVVDKAIEREAKEAEYCKAFYTGRTGWEMFGFNVKGAELGLTEEPV